MLSVIPLRVEKRARPICSQKDQGVSDRRSLLISYHQLQPDAVFLHVVRGYAADVRSSQPADY